LARWPADEHISSASGIKNFLFDGSRPDIADYDLRTGEISLVSGSCIRVII